MNNRTRIAAFAILACFSALAAKAQDSAVGDSAKEGHRLALKFCTPCHVVSSDQTYTPLLNPPAPTFLSIANRQGPTAQSLRVFLASTHATEITSVNMPNPKLPADEAEEMISFILSLRAGH